MSQKLLLDDEPEGAPREARRGRCYCPACGYNPVIDAMDNNREVEAKGLPVHLIDSVPQTWEESLEWFEVMLAEENCVICPRCGTNFNPQTGVIAEIDLDSAD